MKARSAKAVCAIAALTLFSLPASALPPADGSKCSSSWVNNAGAMACFTQGEEETRNGSKNPHYVACTSDGTIYCCVTNAAGGQSCVPAGDQHASHGDWLRGILAAQRAHMKSISVPPDKHANPNAMGTEPTRAHP